MHPARAVGGDFYDFFLIDHDRVFFTIGDVSDKGVPSALFMAVVRTVLRATMHRTGRITYCDGGHEPPIIIRSNGRPELVDKVGGVALGCLEGMTYRCGELQLEPGDLLLLYTDGITEAMDASEDFFSRSRLLTTLGEIGAAGGPEGVTHQLLMAVEAFRGQAPQADDITLIALRYRGAVAPSAGREGHGSAEGSSSPAAGRQSFVSWT